MIYVLVSINTDYFYQVPHIPAPGETLMATGLSQGLGGKGANQAVAMSNAGAQLRAIGAVGPDGDWALGRLRDLGVSCDYVTRVDHPTAHAIITLAEDGENAITVFPGANKEIPQDHVVSALSDISAGDWLVLQNETNHQVLAAQTARAKGAKIAYSAAPFDVDAVQAMLPYIDLLVVNAVEAQQLSDALGQVTVPQMIITHGSKGAEYREGEKTVSVQGISVNAVDTTGAGDTFIGFFIGRLAEGDDVETALNLANKAAAVKVTRKGTADAIPLLSDL